MRSAAGPCRNVVDKWIGGATAPVSGSVSAPACTARVSSRIACFLVAAELAQVRAQCRQVTVMVRMQAGAACTVRAGRLAVDEQHSAGRGAGCGQAGMEERRDGLGPAAL